MQTSLGKESCMDSVLFVMMNTENRTEAQGTASVSVLSPILTLFHSCFSCTHPWYY